MHLFVIYYYNITSYLYYNNGLLIQQQKNTGPSHYCFRFLLHVLIYCINLLILCVWNVVMEHELYKDLQNQFQNRTKR